MLVDLKAVADAEASLNRVNVGPLWLDNSSSIEATGGINKDSGYLLFSPHANLHLKAAALAINHTEIFFNQIREKIGDAEFAKFLDLEIDNATLNTSSNTIICSAIRISFGFWKIPLVLNFFFIFLFF